MDAASASGSVAYRRRKGRHFKLNLNQQEEIEFVEETVSLNEESVPYTISPSHHPITSSSTSSNCREQEDHFVIDEEDIMATETRLSPSRSRSPQMAAAATATRELIGRNAGVLNAALKKMPSEPAGLTAFFRSDSFNNDRGSRRVSSEENREASKPSPLENYSILEELGDSGYGKNYRVKRLTDDRSFTLKCIAHKMQRPSNNDTSFTMPLDETRALAILAREILAHSRVNGHPNFPTMHESWFSVYDLNDVPSTPSLGQPFDLNTFCLDRFLRKRRANGYGLSDDDQEEEEEEGQLVDFEMYGRRLLTAILKEQPLDRAGKGPIVIVWFAVLDYCPFDLSDYLATSNSPATASADTSSESSSHFFQELLRIALILYDCDLVHLGMHPNSIGLIEVDSQRVVLRPRLMDFGINRYFEIRISDLRYNPLVPSVFQAPEVESQQNDALSWAADIYSLGMILVDFCLRREGGDSTERTRTLDEIKSGDLSSLRGLRLPSTLAQVLERMLSHEPDHRPSPWEILDLISSEIQPSGLDHIPESCRARIAVEMPMLRCRLQYRNWLKRVPKSLWLSVVQSCAKEMLEKYLLHLGRLDADLDDSTSSSSCTIASTEFDVRFLMNALRVEADATKCVEGAATDDGDLLQATVWYLWTKYGKRELQASGELGKEEQWIKGVKIAYEQIFRKMASGSLYETAV